MPNPFAINTQPQDDITIIRLEGYLDAHTAPQFERAIEDEIGAGRTRIVVDCQNLTYISSAGLGVFMSFIEEVREQGGDIKVAALQPKVESVFEVLGFSEIFDISADAGAAIARFQNASTAQHGEG